MKVPGPKDIVKLALAQSEALRELAEFIIFVLKNDYEQEEKINKLKNIISHSHSMDKLYQYHLDLLESKTFDSLAQQIEEDLKNSTRENNEQTNA